MIDLIQNKGRLFVRDDKVFYPIQRPIFSFRNYLHLRNRSLIIGLVGPRGSGKSVGAARIVVLDYLLRGKAVWSNMEIGIRIPFDGEYLTLTTQPLDKLELADLAQVYHDGVLFIDEVNMEIAEARRAMSTQNLMFSYILQQLRKRRLNLIWTAQSEMHVEDRLRWQTDFFITCTDASLDNNGTHCGVGELSHWTVYDYAGMITGHPPSTPTDSIIWRGTIRNKPWWNAYSTWQMQGIDKEVENVEEATEDPEDCEAERIASEISAYFKEVGKESISPSTLWRLFGVQDHNMRIRVGKALRGHGIEKSANGRRYITVES